MNLASPVLLSQQQADDDNGRSRHPAVPALGSPSGAPAGAGSRRARPERVRAAAGQPPVPAARPAQAAGAVSRGIAPHAAGRGPVLFAPRLGRVLRRRPRHRQDAALAAAPRRRIPRPDRGPGARRAARAAGRAARAAGRAAQQRAAAPSPEAAGAQGSADRPGQPHGARRRTGHRGGTRAALRSALRDADCRHRPFQAHQRLARPQRRRPGDPRRGGTGCATACAPTTRPSVSAARSSW